MPPRIPVFRETAMDPFRKGASQSAMEFFQANPYAISIGFALVPLYLNDGIPSGWIYQEFKSINEGLTWLHGIESRETGYVYACIFLNSMNFPVIESFGNSVTSDFTTRVPASWSR